MPFGLRVRGTISTSGTSVAGGGFHVMQPIADALLETAADLTTAWEKIVSEVLRPAMEQQFATEGAHLDVPWAELLPETVRRRRGSAHPILQRTGALAESFIEGSEHLEEINPDSLEWGSVNRAAPFHQMGTARMVARQPLNVTDALVEQIMAVIKADIEERAANAGFTVER